MDGPKLEWMYKNLNEVVDEEQYLLGKPIDRAFEQSQSNEIEKDCLPTSIFANAGSNVQVDVIRKLKEDPLEAIKQQEIEKRKQLLKNPVQLKKLQNMLKVKDASGLMNNKKTKEKKQKEDDASDIDKLLASKYRKIMKKHGIKSLSELTDMKVERKNKYKKNRKSSGESSSSSIDSSDEEDNKKNKEALRKKKLRRSTSSDSSCDRKTKHRHSYKSKETEYNVKGQNYYKNRDYKRAHLRPSSEKASSDKYRREDRSKNHKTSSSRDFSNEYEYKSRVGNSESRDRKYKNNSLSETEKQKRLEEMMNNAKWRDDVRTKNMARYKKEESSETNENYREDFLRKQMGIMLATSNDSVESRIKSNINNIQKSKFTMNENFVRR